MSVTQSALKTYHNLYQNSNSLFFADMENPTLKFIWNRKAQREKKKKILKMKTKLKDFVISHLLISKLTKKLQ